MESVPIGMEMESAACIRAYQAAQRKLQEEREKRGGEAKRGREKKRKE